MNARTVTAQLQGEESRLRALGVKKLILFGAILHHTVPAGSPLDFLVELHPPITYERFLALRDFLQETLACPVEPVLESLQHHEVWPLIKDEAITILE